MRIYQTPTFARAYKKLHKRERALIDTAIAEIVKKPTIGSLKTGDLPDFRVHKFKDGKLEWLLAYNYEPGYGLELIDLGSHQNFYQRQKRRPVR